jgi:hypothetical protein
MTGTLTRFEREVSTQKLERLRFLPPSRPPTLTCEADQFLMTACGDSACVSLPTECVLQPTCECLRSNPLCEEENCSREQREAADALEFDAECSTRADGSLRLDVPPIDYC